MKSNDPRKPVYDSVMAKMAEIECYPTFEAIRDVEFIRESGATNMFATTKVYECLIMMGCDAGAVWIGACLRHKKEPFLIYNAVMEKFEAEHGPRSSWVTPELRISYKKRGLLREKRLVEAKLRALSRIEDETEDDE